MIRIIGTGSYLPDIVIGNGYFEELMATSDEWIVSKTGIRTRRFARADQATSDLAVPAALRAMEAARVTPSDIGLVIVSRAFGDYASPAVASAIQSSLGCDHAAVFDIVAGCTGFLFALEVAAGMVERSSRNRPALVIAAELLSRDLDFTDRTSSIFLGDGAGAAVVSSEPESGMQIVASYLASSSDGYEWATTRGGGTRFPPSVASLEAGHHAFRMDGPKIFRYAIDELPRVAIKVLEEAGMGVREVDLFVPHQANLRLIEAVASRLSVSMERVVTNVESYGNTSSAGIAIALDEALRSGRIAPGSSVMLLGVGAGMTSGAMLLRMSA